MLKNKFKFLRYNSKKEMGQILKKAILFILLTSSLFAEAKLYMGTGYTLYNEHFNTPEADITDSAAKLKFGYGIREAYSVEFSVDYINHASTDNVALGKAKYGFNIALIKAFDFDTFLNPYVKAGFGTGIMDNSDNNNSSLSYGSFDLGTGVYIPINENFDVEIGYEYRNLSYEKQNKNSATKYASNVNTLYLGVNVRF